MIWVTVLLGLLSLLLQWWMNRKSSGVPPTDREIHNTERVFGLIEQIKGVAVPMGCRSEGIPYQVEDGESAPHPLMTALTTDDMEWKPGDIISDRLYAFIVSNYVVPYLQKKFPGIPGQTDQWQTFLVQQIKDSQA